MNYRVKKEVNMSQAVRTWGQETLRAEGLILKAFVLWLGTMILLPILAFTIILGGAPKIVTAVYSCFVIIPILILFQFNALLYCVLAICGVSVNYNGALYLAVKWIERKQLYNATKARI